MMNALYAPANEVTSAYFEFPIPYDMLNAAVWYRPSETCRTLVTRGTIVNVSRHWGGRVWVKIRPDDANKIARWYIASDVIVSYVWGTPEPCACCRGCSVIVENRMQFPCPECCKIDEMS